MTISGTSTNPADSVTDMKADPEHGATTAVNVVSSDTSSDSAQGLAKNADVTEGTINDDTGHQGDPEAATITKGSQNKDNADKKKMIALIVMCVVGIVIVGLTLGLMLGTNSGNASSSASTSSSSNGMGNENTGSDTVAEAEKKWPHELSDIPLDPTMVFGSLDNGLRYMILPHQDPPGQVFLRMHVNAGSFHEDDDQLGLAHFLEHMMFNGLKSFGADELVEQVQRYGIPFGSHLNAYTTFHETVYKLGLPQNDTKILDFAFTVLRDWMDGALLLDDEIEKERGVILSEMDLRDQVRTRLELQALSFLLPDSLITSRFPIGTVDSILSMPPSEFREFYNEFYIPERITIVAVGDMDPDFIEKKIINAFENGTNPEMTGAIPDLGTVKSGTGFKVTVFEDSEFSSNELSLYRVSPYQPRIETTQVRFDQLALNMANFILARRLDAIVSKENSTITDGGSIVSQWASAVQFGKITVFNLDGHVDSAVTILEQEFRRFMEFGVTQSEYMEVRAIVLNTYERRVESADTRDSSKLIESIVNTISTMNVLTTPEEDLRILTEIFEFLTPEMVHEAFFEFWDTGDLSIVYLTGEALTNATDMISSAYNQSQQVSIDPPENADNITFAYTDFGSPGVVVEDNFVEDLQIRQIVLSNGIRVNIKATDFEDKSVVIKARFGGGLLSQPPNSTGLHSFATTVIETGGLGNHSLDELRRVTAGKSVGWTFSVQNDHFSFVGGTTPGDFEMQMQLLAAHLTDPGYRDEAVRRFQNSVPTTISDYEHTLNGPSQEKSYFLTGEDDRFGVPTEDMLLSYDIDDLQNWLGPAFSQSYLEVSIVGEIPPNYLDFVLSTIGALSDREESSNSSTDTQITFPEPPQDLRLFYDSVSPQAVSIVSWQTPARTESTINVTRSISVLSNVFSDRLRVQVREEMGAAYAFGSRLLLWDGIDYGEFESYAVVDPVNTTVVLDRILQIAIDLAESGISEDELIRASEPFYQRLEDGLRSNAYWLISVLDGSGEKPYKFEWNRNRRAFYDSLSVQDINDIASTYLQETLAITVEMLPSGIVPDDGGGHGMNNEANNSTNRYLQVMNDDRAFF